MTNLSKDKFLEAVDKPSTHISEHTGPDMLSALPSELLIEFYYMLPAYSEKSRFVRTSKKLHHMFEAHLYQEAATTLSWFPMFFAARQGNISTLDKCTEYGAPAEMSWSESLSFVVNMYPSIKQGHTPLDEAISGQHVNALIWLLAHGACPNRRIRPHRLVSPLTRACWMGANNSITLGTAQHRPQRSATQRLREQTETAMLIVSILVDAGAVKTEPFEFYSSLERQSS
ncbi:hypothetical protein FZEAL_3637 [Fusarium zealandicum]|uniref:F-box domain-containing protein n=1 Tax=Fusarium zealandicum TaxID=1053134 RepID=A0A8H4UNE9_9HYPO|nr:hypothetical protein FZEAL_3637 [Fusarium zealandicum]